ncbi:FAD-dependent oxidoreductase [Paenibacillus monticola]|uniref:FAD-dependent oxidoreductase n=1 Tax=Paenibacillus monticola TaxID=2666075 RepID=A0A7X2HAV2_9BACL|nr:FAD-dependent oxidoreductase [Paenibacillus monticola]MRN56732.1 FAD-dependent oxidoreductase [Paenibacillus monticola]
MYNIVVYGATSAGVAAAVQAARLGRKVLLIANTEHIGGMTSSGLGATDINNRKGIGGIAREFYGNVYRYYAEEANWTRQTPDAYDGLLGTRFWLGRDEELKIRWMFEPKVASVIYENMLGEAGVEIVRNERLALGAADAVVKKNGWIISIRMESGKVYEADFFMDTGYEGDMMALAGVSYVTGREVNSLYGELTNGVFDNGPLEGGGISPYLVSNDPDSGLLPYVLAECPGKNGEADHRVQAYCYRFTLSSDPANQLPIEKPADYNPMRHELLARRFEVNPSLTLDDILTLTPIPNRKTDTNHVDFVGANYSYADGDYQTRERIEAEHRAFTLGTLWFLANDKRVPEKVRQNMQQWGLAADEFLDNRGFPVQIYVREGRRLVSDYVMTELSVKQRTAPQSVGLGTYYFDSHYVSHYAQDGQVYLEGTFWEDDELLYPVSYQSIRPRREECSNLLLPVTLSSSHAAYGSIRMEPVYMVLGQSAAIAASLCLELGVTVQDLPYEVLRARLLDAGQILDAEPLL